MRESFNYGVSYVTVQIHYVVYCFFILITDFVFLFLRVHAICFYLNILFNMIASATQLNSADKDMVFSLCIFCPVFLNSTDKDMVFSLCIFKQIRTFSLCIFCPVFSFDKLFHNTISNQNQNKFQIQMNQ